jgi:hypothetical protein
LTAPVEFIVTDQQNNPLTFTDFATSFGLKFSSLVMSSLADNFSLYIYNDQGNIRLGLAVDSKNDVSTKARMFNEEPNLVSEISPLFLDTSFTAPKTVSFNSSNYANTQIYYLNLATMQNQPLSIDYTIFNKKLIIGTSKMTLRSILDKAATPVTMPANQ